MDKQNKTRQGKAKQGKRQKDRQSQGWREGKTQLRFISRHKYFFKKSKHESDFTLLPGVPEGAFFGKHDHPRLFQSCQGEI